MDRRVDFGLSLAVIALGVFILVTSFTAKQPTVVFDPVGPYGFARVISLVFILFGGILLVRQVRAYRLGLPPEAVARGNEDEDGYPASSRRAFAVIASTFAYAIVMVQIGYLIPSVVYIVGGLLLFGERKWRWILPLAIVYAFFTYWVFDVLLRVPLPEGPLEDFLSTVGFGR